MLLTTAVVSPPQNRTPMVIVAVPDSVMPLSNHQSVRRKRRNTGELSTGSTANTRMTPVERCSECAGKNVDTRAVSPSSR